MVTSKGGWGKLYYTQYTLLSNVGQLPILFFAVIIVFDNFLPKQTYTIFFLETNTHI